jgi:hypothetical protein
MEHGQLELYIKLTDDKSVIPPGLQDQAAVNISAKVISLKSGHMAPLTHPRELAAILNQIAAGTGNRLSADPGPAEYYPNFQVFYFQLSV